MSKPLISVIIPTYNQKKYILDAIHSILAQTIPALEIIVVDDGSVDNTHEVFNTCQTNILYYQQCHQGAGAARNTGVGLAQGEWIAFLDADDLWLPQKLKLQLAFAEAHHSNIIFSHIQQFISPELCRGTLANITLKNEIMPGYCASTLLIKKEIFSDIGYFDPTYTLGEFMAWYIRLQKSRLPFHLIDDVVVRRRIHQDNTSSKNKTMRHDYLRVFYEARNDPH